MDDNVIIKKLQNRDEAGLNQLIVQYGPYVSAILANLCRQSLSPQDVEELAADVFLKIWNHSGNLQTDTPLKPYLAQTARNTAISRLRQCKHPNLPFDDDILTVSSGGPDELAAAHEQRQILNQTVASWPQPERDIFIRYYFFGEPAKSIAKALGLKNATVKTKLFRCRGRLKQAFQERGYAYEEANEN